MFRTLRALFRRPEGRPVRNLATPFQRAERRIVVAFLRRHPCSTLEQIAVGTGLPPAGLAQTLCHLELYGYIDGTHGLDDSAFTLTYIATGKEL